MRVDLERYGIWQRASDATAEVARMVESLGFGALWLGGSPAAELREIEMILDATESMPVATGIVNMWKADAGAVAESFRRIDRIHPGRFLLGVGIGHPEATSEYRKPYATMVEYLDRLDESGVPRDQVALAALGPRVLELSASRTAGAHPYLTTPRHTRFARGVLGESPLLAPGHAVVVTSDQESGREIGRDFVRRYLRLVNYRRNLLREGWTEQDLADGGSDRLVDELVLVGSADHIASGLRAHVDAGANHVTIQALGPDTLSSYEALADAVL